MDDLYNGFGLSRVKQEGTTQISLPGLFYVNIPNTFLEGLGLHSYHGRWYPTKIMNAFISGLAYNNKKGGKNSHTVV